MAEGTSRGKQSFREFTKAANELKRLTERAIKYGEQYTIEDLEGWYDELVEEYGRMVEEQDIPNPELWVSRAHDKASGHIGDLCNRFPSLLEFNEEGDNESEERDDESVGVETEASSILGIPIISESECIANGHSARGQVLLTLEELIEYLEPIPPSVINGLIPVFDDTGTLVGYRLCGAKNT